MGLSKTDNYNYKEKELAKFYKALAHPARIAILNVLMKKNACVCGDIVDELPIAQATVSQHLKELKGAGLIKGEISGKNICYCADYDAWERFNDLDKELFKNLETMKCNC